MKILSQFYSFPGFVTIYFFFLVSLIFLHTLASPTLERNALLEFKNEFPIPAPVPDPDDLTDRCLSSWNTSTDHCSWEGVTCDDKSGEVISLFLSYIQLNGSLKSNSSLFKLQHLRELNLIHCDLIGEIPSSLGNLSRLTELRLSENHLVGEVPASLGNLNQLELLSLSSNNLTGNIPISFANFNKLSDLDLSKNQFTNGDFSRILANLTSLSKLDLSHNHFKSKLPADMSGLQNLERLDASGNSFFGNVPTSLFTLPSLVGVYLRENQFEGPLEFGETSFKLLDLDLAHNNLIGTIPESISQLVNLSSLDLSHNNIIGTIPRSMFKLASLESLDLSYNKLEGQVPSFLWSLYWVRLSHNSFSSLENSLEGIFRVGIFELASNSLQGLLPQCICNSTRLNLFDVSNNHLTGSIPSCLKNAIAQPTYMILRNNNFTGVIPDIFIDATQLQSLDLSRNQLVGRLPKSLMNCSSLRFLNVKGNKIKDTFPYWLKSLEYLRLLLLGSNAFYGPIYSSAYLGFPTLRVIDISHNRFNGTLPLDYFANWLEMSSVVWIEEGGSRGESASPYSGRELHRDSMDMMYKGVDTDFSLIFMGYKAIDFSGNKFQGRIPKSIGLLKDLRLLNLSGNAFTGNIPSSLANITNLEALDLSRNKLSGQIPHDLGNLSFLSYLDFSHNHLQGPVPRSTQFQRQNCSSFEDNLGLSGLEDICRKIHVPDAKLQLPEDFSSERELDLSSHMLQLNWIAAAVAYVPGVFCGLVIGHIFTSHKHKWFMEKFGRNKPSGIISVH